MYHDEQFDILRTLISELRGRMPPNLTERQYQDIGSWMLKAMWLGQGRTATEVLSINDNAKPPLSIVR